MHEKKQKYVFFYATLFDQSYLVASEILQFSQTHRNQTASSLFYVQLTQIH